MALIAMPERQVRRTVAARAELRLFPLRVGQRLLADLEDHLVRRSPLERRANPIRFEHVPLAVDVIADLDDDAEVADAPRLGRAHADRRLQLAAVVGAEAVAHDPSRAGVGNLWGIEERHVEALVAVAHVAEVHRAVWRVLRLEIV